MADTYRNVYLHIVFAVKNRDALLDVSCRNRLFAYTSKVLTNRGHYALAVNVSHITRSYFHLYIYLKTKATKKSLDVLKKTNLYFADMFSSASREDVAKKHNTHLKLSKQVNNLLDDKTENHKIVSYCINILNMTSACNSLLLQLNY